MTRYYQYFGNLAILVYQDPWLSVPVSQQVWHNKYLKRTFCDKYFTLV